MQLAYYAPQLADAINYDKLKEEILAHCGLSPTNIVMEFHKWTWKTRAVNI